MNRRVEVITWFTRFSFDRTAQDLETTTLGYQIHQAYEAFKFLTGREENSELDENSPVLRMWEGHEFALGIYGMSMGDQFTRIRRNVDTLFFDFYHDIQSMKKEDENFVYEKPPWFNDADVCRSHRSNLMRRQPENYKTTWPKTPVNMPYLWPFIDDSPEGYTLMVSKAERALLKKGERKLPLSIKARVGNL